MLVISPTARISKFVDIEDSVRGSRIVIEDNVTIDSFVKIKPVGGSADVIIGAHTYINSGCVIYSGNGVTIGRHVLIGPNCTIAPVNHEYRSKHKLICQQGFMPGKGGIVLEDDVWVGAATTFLDGCIVRRGVVIGANSLVRGELEAYGVYAGNPIRLIGKRE